MKNVHFFSILLLMLACFVPQAARAEYYGIKVAGVSVTSDNCNNITSNDIYKVWDKHWGYDWVMDFYDGVSFVRYEPSTKTLTLHNVDIDRYGKNNRAIFNESCDGLTIVFEGTNYLKANEAAPIRLQRNTIITSSTGKYGGHLSIHSNREGGIFVCNNAKVFIDNIFLAVSGSDDYGNTYGISIEGDGNDEELHISNSYVFANGEIGVAHFKKLSTKTSIVTFKGGNSASLDIKEFDKSDSMFFDNDTSFSEENSAFCYNTQGSIAMYVRITTHTPIDETTFPDSNFRNVVQETFDTDHDLLLDFDEITVYYAENLDLSGKEISSLKGVELLPYLRNINCSNNNLTSIDLSSLYYLKELDCSNNQLTRLTYNNGLEKLNCSYNNLTYIDFSCADETFSPSLKDINITYNNINTFMTETLQSLPDIYEYYDSPVNLNYNIYITAGGTDGNVCTQEQANIAKRKGWKVYINGLDDEGNMVYDIYIAGSKITSANAGDLTVLPNVTKNCDDGYARYEPATQKLHLSGVDIVNEEGDGIKFNIKELKPTIEIGQDPVNITAKGEGISYDPQSIHPDKDGLLTITSKDDYWFSEKLNVISTENHAFYIKGSLILQGVARIEAKTLSNAYPFHLYGTLYVKNDAELRIKSNGKFTLEAKDLVLEDDNIVVTHPGATIPEGNGSLCDAEGHTIRDEVVIGKLREYNYYVAGTRISNANQHAVLGDTTVVFQEPEFNGGAGTLVLTNANIDAGSEAGINAGKTLYIKLEGENTINSTTYGIASKYCYIQGPGSLYVNGKYGIDAHLSKLFISDDAKVTAEGSTQYAINGQETTISGENTVVRMKCGPDARGTFRASTSLTLNDGLKIESPEGAQYVDGEIKDADGNVIKDEWVTIQYTEDYGIKVAGTQVTNHNMADVLGDGTISYDPETLTLTLTDANIDGGDGSGIEAEQELHIKLEGSNTITCTRSLNGTSHGIWFKDKGFIEGPGSLSINAMYGIYTIGNNQPKPLQILDGAQVSAEGDLIGIMAGTTTISGETTIINAKGGNGSFGCTALNLNDELEITEPAGASFNLSKLAICVGRRNDIVTSWVTIQKVNKYDVYVAGTQVTSLNQADVLGDGTVSYDAETNTLTLNNANIVTEAESEFSISAIEINIRLEGENKITSEGSGIMGHTLSIEATTDDSHGPGSLDIIASYTGIRATSSLKVCGGAHVTAESTGSYAILTQFLTVSGAETVLGMKGEEGTYSGFAPELEDGLELTQPVGAYYNVDTGNIVNAEGEAIKGEWVVIGAPVSVESYEIFIAGIQVTELNKDDILGDGTVSYDAETNTLTLNGADIEAEGEGLSTQIDEVIIKLEGENSIEVPEGFGIYSDASFTITGPGSLSVTSKFEALDGSFVIEGGAKVTADSQTRSALWSFDPLAVSGSETVVMLKGAKGAVEIYGADSEEAVLSLSDGLVLGLPEGAHCGIVDVLVDEEEDMWIPYGYILDANDNNITDQWVVICSQDHIDGIESLTPARSEGKDLLYNLAGQKVGKDYKGIVIMNGRKVLKM